MEVSTPGTVRAITQTQHVVPSTRNSASELLYIAVERTSSRKVPRRSAALRFVRRYGAHATANELPRSTSAGLVFRAHPHRLHAAVTPLGAQGEGEKVALQGARRVR